MAGKAPNKAAALRALACAAMAIGIAVPASAPAQRAAAAASAETGWIAFRPAPYSVILFDMRLDGQPVRAVLDTGATRSVVAAALAQRLGLALHSARTVEATGGRVSLPTAAGIRLEMGTLVARDMEIGVGDLAALNVSLGQPFDLILGMDVLGRAALEIDYAAGRFRLAPSGSDLPGAASFPLRFSPDHVSHWIEAPLAGAARMRLHIDTGDDGFLKMTEAAAARLDRRGAPTTSFASRGLGGLVIEGLFVMPRLTVGPLAVPDVPVTIEGPGGFSASRGVDGIVGMSLLGRFHAMLDFPAGRARLQADPRPAPPTPRSSTGLQFDFRDGRLEVIHVMANGPAAAAGWHAGDCIGAVDGIPVANVDRDRRTAGWSRAAPGRIVTLTMCDGSTRALTLARFY